MASQQDIHYVSGRAWRPSIRRHVPWPSLICIVGFICCTVGLGVVLATSHNHPVDQWPTPSQSKIISVSVLLSLLTGIANICLAGALSKAYEVAWWRKAVRGAELHRLQFDIGVQNDISVLASRSFTVDVFSVAAVVALAVNLLDGPLMQKASTIVTKTFAPVAANLTVHALDGPLPANFSGYGYQTDLLMPLFSDISHNYSSNAPIALSLDACGANTTCTFSLPGPGFDIGCTESAAPYDFADLSSAGTPNNITTFNITIAFSNSVDITNDEYTGIDTSSAYNTINTTATYKSDSACAGQMQTRSCVMRLGTVSYPLTVTDGVVTLGAWDPTRNDTLSLVAVEPGTARGVTYTGYYDVGQTMLGGVYYVLDALYGGSVNLLLRSMTTVAYLMASTGQSGSNYVTSGIDTYSNCTMTWSDPTSDIVNTLRALMLRSTLAYAAANATAASPQVVAAQQTRVAATYQSDYKYLAATLASMAVEMLLILIMLSGWRRLGRSVSLDPFEIALALGAPLLQRGSSNSDIDTAVEPIRHTKLRYGEIRSGGGGDVAAASVTAGNGDLVFMQDLSGPNAGGYAYAPVDGEDGPQQKAQARLGLVQAGDAGAIRRDILY